MLLFSQFSTCTPQDHVCSEPHLSTVFQSHPCLMDKQQEGESWEGFPLRSFPLLDPKNMSTIIRTIILGFLIFDALWGFGRSHLLVGIILDILWGVSSFTVNSFQGVDFTHSGLFDGAYNITKQLPTPPISNQPHSTVSNTTKQRHHNGNQHHPTLSNSNQHPTS